MDLPISSNGGSRHGVPAASFDQLNVGGGVDIINTQMNGGEVPAGEDASQGGRGNPGIGGVADGKGNKTNGASPGNGASNEHGKVNGDGGPQNDNEGAGDDMELEAPPKEDPMVDYTDEFGRVRTMKQR